ncbi:hypothetical protein KCP71_11330 [Salmonella enterica subsp. enterica]|nr:hypothetical protein KCP71_11330 [Salmonella enterica subsp. enterica]
MPSLFFFRPPYCRHENNRAIRSLKRWSRCAHYHSQRHRTLWPGNAGSSNSACGKPHVRCGLPGCNFVEMLTGITAITFSFAWSAKAVHGACQPAVAATPGTPYLPLLCLRPTGGCRPCRYHAVVSLLCLRNTAWAGTSYRRRRRVASGRLPPGGESGYVSVSTRPPRVNNHAEGSRYWRLCWRWR